MNRFRQVCMGWAETAAIVVFRHHTQSVSVPLLSLQIKSAFSFSHKRSVSQRGFFVARKL